MEQLNPKQKVFSKEDILKEIEAGTDFGKEILEMECEYYMELLKGL